MALTSNKLSKKAKRLVVQMLAEDATYSEIVEAVKAQFKIRISSANVGFYNGHRADEIRDLRKQYYDNLIEEFPLTAKGCRIREIVNDYKKAKSGFLRSRLREELRKEIGEDVKTLADAMAKSGGDNIVNIGITGDADRLIEESAAILGLERTEDRM
ncbi:MAG: DUF2280 domain-containing protein [Deltaproteobacteria bacterium]|nr:DUF2280 domain-containing protein [Deltaproteobacteria bacterium]